MESNLLLKIYFLYSFRDQSLAPVDAKTVLHLASLRHLKRHKLDFYFYTDDTQIYFAFKSNAANNNNSRFFFFHLRSLTEIRDCVFISDTETLVHAFISCNSLLYGPPKFFSDRFQKLQNSATRLIARSRKYNRITSILNNSTCFQSDIYYL